MKEEIEWKDIKGFEGIYQISNTGLVRSLDRIIGLCRYKGKMKSVYINAMGYQCVTLCKNKHSKAYTIHRLLAEAFIPNPEKKPCVDHINTITTDNRLENLRWVTYKENTRNVITYEKLKNQLLDENFIKSSIQKRKEKYGKIKDVYQFTLDGKFVAKYYSLQEAQRKTGIFYTAIKRVCVGRDVSAGGFFWSYEKKFTPRKKNYHGFRVKQISKSDNKIVIEYDSLSIAAKENKCSIAKIQRQINCPFDSDEYVFELIE